MDNKPSSPSTHDEYIAQFPPEVQALLEQVRATVRAAAPDAREKISYQMPGFELNGNLVWYAAFQHHIGFYPTAEGIEAFKDELGPYKFSKGAVQFPLNQPLPTGLITRMVQHRVAQNLKKKR